jgi:hypothetical protein
MPAIARNPTVSSCSLVVHGQPIVRYFFNIIVGTSEIIDPEGTELPNEQAAHAEALAIAAELLHEFPDRFGHSSVLEVLSEDRRRIMALPLRSRRERAT